MLILHHHSKNYIKSWYNYIGYIIYENNFDINIAMDNSNSEMTDLFNYIKISIYEEPEKYDYVIKK